MTASTLHLSSILPLHIKIKKVMNTLKAIQNCFPPTNYVFLQPHKFPNKKNTSLFLCKSNDQGSESSSQSQPEGDANKQDLLVKIAMLQAQKVRLTDYLDERSAYLTQYAEDANAEFDEIGETTLKDLDEAEARIMEKLDGKMQEFEESSESSRQEIEEDEKMLDDFEDLIDEGRNEGLFFKNLGTSTKKPDDENRAKAKAIAKEEAEKIREIERQLAGSKIRKNVYLGLIVLMGVGIGDALASAADWRKIAALTVILVALLSQYIYEQGISSKNDKEQ